MSNLPPSPSEPEQTPSLEQTLREAEKRRIQRLSRGSSRIIVPSFGEKVLPILLVLMESCCAVGLLLAQSVTVFFGSAEPLLPLWSPPLLSLTTFYLVRRQQENVASREQLHTGGQSLLAVGFLLVLLFLIWLRFYTAQFFLDPRWLLSLCSDFLFFNAYAWQTLAISSVSLLLGWRGTRLADHLIEPSHVTRELWVGGGLLILAILVCGGRDLPPSQAYNQPTLLVLTPTFLSLGLMAHALANTTFVRRFHTFGLERNNNPQERSLTLLLAFWGLLTTLLVVGLGLLLNREIFDGLLHLLGYLAIVYDFIAQVLAFIVVVVVTPIFWLLERLPFHLPHLRQINPLSNPSVIASAAPNRPDIYALLVLAIKIIVPVVVLITVYLLARKIFRSRSILLRKREEITHESFWSWSLFWSQIVGIWRAFVNRLLRRSPTKEVESLQIFEVEGRSDSAARSVREIYRAFLYAAMGQGYTRKRNETPGEFEARLQQTSLADPNLEALTRTYSGVRYGDESIEEDRIKDLRGRWEDLERRWQRAQR